MFPTCLFMGIPTWTRKGINQHCRHTTCGLHVLLTDPFPFTSFGLSQSNKNIDVKCSIQTISIRQAITQPFHLLPLNDRISGKCWLSHASLTLNDVTFTERGDTQKLAKAVSLDLDRHVANHPFTGIGETIGGAQLPALLAPGYC